MSVLALDTDAELAEGPVWDERSSKLWWVDIDACTVHRFDPATGVDEEWAVYGPVGALDSLMIPARALA